MLDASPPFDNPSSSPTRPSRPSVSLGAGERRTCAPGAMSRRVVGRQRLPFHVERCRWRYERDVSRGTFGLVPVLWVPSSPLGATSVAGRSSDPPAVTDARLSSRETTRTVDRRSWQVRCDHHVTSSFHVKQPRRIAPLLCLWTGLDPLEAIRAFHVKRGRHPMVTAPRDDGVRSVRCDPPRHGRRSPPPPRGRRERRCSPGRRS